MEEAKHFLTPMVSHLSRPINGVASPGLGMCILYAFITNHRALSSGIVNDSLPFVSAGKNVSVANKCISSEVTTVNPAVSHFRPKMVLNGAASQGTGKSSCFIFHLCFRRCSCSGKILIVFDLENSIFWLVCYGFIQ